MNKKYRLNRVINWIILNSIYCTLAWYGVHGSNGAANLFIFMVWIMTVSTIVIGYSNELLAQARKKGFPVPRLPAIIIDICAIILVIWHGWFITGIAMLVLLMTETFIYDTKD